jgi:hypothetical protein
VEYLAEDRVAALGRVLQTNTRKHLDSLPLSMIMSLGRLLGTKKCVNASRVTRSELISEIKAVNAKPAVLHMLVSTAFCPALCCELIVLPGYCKYPY